MQTQNTAKPSLIINWSLKSEVWKVSRVYRQYFLLQMIQCLKPNILCWHFLIRWVAIYVLPFLSIHLQRHVPGYNSVNCCISLLYDNENIRIRQVRPNIKVFCNMQMMRMSARSCRTNPATPCRQYSWFVTHAMSPLVPTRDLSPDHLEFHCLLSTANLL